MLPRFLHCGLYIAAASIGWSLIFPSSLVLATAAKSIHFSGPSVVLNENLLSNEKYFLFQMKENSCKMKQDVKSVSNIMHNHTWPNYNVHLTHN